MSEVFRYLMAGVLAASIVVAQASRQQMRQTFEAGEQALQTGDLIRAEEAFQRVLSITPADVGARVNLGVIYMRQGKWKPALAEFTAARKLAPALAGIRLNIGIAYYRQGDYVSAIPAFASVVRDQPESTQARRLLGLCYLFELRYAEAADTLQPLWDQASTDLSYLYALSVAAAGSGRKDLDQRAVSRLLEVGRNSPALHLLVGKAHLAHDEDEQALDELQKAAAGDPNLPMLHYHLGVVYRRRQELTRAREEFLRDIALEPNVAYDYDQLGAVCASLGDYREARRAFEKAVALNPSLAPSWYGLAKIARQEKRYAEGLSFLRKAGAADPQSPSVHYLRSQILSQMGRNTEARAELLAMRRLQQETTSKLEREISGKYRDPQIAEAPQ